MGAALTALWRALVDLADETLPWLGANLAWFALSLPVSVVVFLTIGLLTGVPPGDQTTGLALPLLSAALVPLLLPSPPSLALGAVARHTVSGDAPRPRLFRHVLRNQAARGTVLGLVSVIGMALLLGNAYFYLVIVPNAWLKLLTILWAYGALFWLGMHVYIVPLALHDQHVALRRLYGNAARLTLASPVTTLVLTLALLAVSLASILMAPLYPLASGAYLALVRAHAFQSLLPEPERVLNEWPRL